MKTMLNRAHWLASGLFLLSLCLAVISLHLHEARRAEAEHRLRARAALTAQTRATQAAAERTANTHAFLIESVQAGDLLPPDTDPLGTQLAEISAQLPVVWLAPPTPSTADTRDHDAARATLRFATLHEDAAMAMIEHLRRQHSGLINVTACRLERRSATEAPLWMLAGQCTFTWITP